MRNSREANLAQGCGAQFGCGRLCVEGGLAHAEMSYGTLPSSEARPPRRAATRRLGVTAGVAATYVNETRTLEVHALVGAGSLTAQMLQKEL